MSGGATCARRRTISEFTPPVVFSQTPTLEQLIEHANHSLAIQRIESNTLTISSPDIMAKLSGNLQWERPHNFNLQAYVGSRVLGTALAAGSNSQEFWLQTQTPPPATLYYARHDDFENQMGPRRILPVSPLWLREALGIVEFDPTFEHEGPLVRTDGKLEVRSLIPSPRGAYRRVVIFAPSTGAIEETVLYDQTGKLVARAQQSEHEYYSAIQKQSAASCDRSVATRRRSNDVVYNRRWFVLAQPNSECTDHCVYDAGHHWFVDDRSRSGERAVGSAGCGAASVSIEQCRSVSSIAGRLSEIIKVASTLRVLSLLRFKTRAQHAERAGYM